MAGYIGGKVAVSAPQQIETKHTITATASQTSIPNVGYTVGAVHVYQNGIRLVDGTDYTATNGSTVTLETGATEGDQIVIVSHGSFETSDTVSKASGGTFSAAMNYPGGAVTGDVTHPDSIKAKFGAGDDLQIYHDGSNSYVDDAGTGALILRGNSNVTIGKYTGETMGFFETDGAVSLYHNNAIKLATTATGIDVTGAITVGGAALGSGGMEFLATSGAISNAASVAFTQFDATKYDHYKFFFQNVIPATDNVILVGQSSTNDGSAYSSTSGNYVFFNGGSGGHVNSIGFPIHDHTNTLGSATNEFGVSAEFTLFAPHNSSSYTYGTSVGVHTDTGGLIRSSHAGQSSSARLAAEDVDAIKFIMSSGNIESGEITMFGIVNS